MTRPAIPPNWATDASYTHGPVIGQPNKSTPSAGERAEGFIPGDPLPADYLNFEFNNHGEWIASLAVASDIYALGSGADGALAFDGSATVLGMAPAAGVYTLTRDIFATDITITGSTTKIKTNGFRIFAQGKVDCSAATTSGAIFTADAGNASGATGGTGSPAGTLQGGSAGGNGGSGAANGATATTINQSKGGISAPGGPAGGGGFVGGGNAGGNPPTGIDGPIITSLAALAGFLASQTGLKAIGGGGGGGGGGANGGGGALGGGGGGGGGVNFIACSSLIVRAATDFSAKGGNGANGVAGGGGGGGGGTGAGGALFLIYRTKNGITFTAATCCAKGATPGAGAGTGGAGSGAANDGTVTEIVLDTLGLTAPTEQRGVAAFAEGGSGAGFDYQDVTLSPSMANTAYIVTLAANVGDDTSGAPPVSYRLKTTAGFRIRPNAQFTGEVSWTAKPA